MAEADVRNLEALEFFLVQLKSFQDRLTRHIEEAKSEIMRIEQWIHSVSPEYWREQDRIARRKWVEAREALARCEAVTRSDDKPACSEHRKRLEKWTSRVRVCENKLRILKAAEAQWRNELQSLQLKLQHLIDITDARLPLARHHLERKLEPLRIYAQMQAGSNTSSKTQATGSEPNHDGAPSVTNSSILNEGFHGANPGDES